MVKLKTLKDCSIEYDKQKKLPADILMLVCALAAAGFIIAGAGYLLTGDMLSLGKNLSELLNKIIIRNMLKEPVIHEFFKDDGKPFAPFIAALFLGSALIIWAIAAIFLKKRSFGIAALCFILIFSTLAGALYPLNVIGRAEDRLRETAAYFKEAVEAVRYDKGEPICEGNFEAKAGLGHTNEAALNIRMQKPQPYYLRGFVGESYNGGGWSRLSPEKLITYNDIFLKLHGAGFDGRQIPSRAVKCIKPEAEENLIKIENTGCNKKYFYLPYEAVRLDAKSTDYIGDSCYTSGEPEESSEYRFTATDYFAASVTDMKKKLADMQSEASCADFLRSEYNYRIFCRENYTDLPEETTDCITKFLGKEPSPDSGKLPSVSEIKKIILESVKEFEYDETVIYSADNGDFIADFLKNKRGYSIHFSTLAAAVFRYYGIPARFAEGYLVTDKDVEGKGANEVIELTQSAYHTWAEYYEDGIGWVPFEATPRYIGVMKSDGSISYSGVRAESERVEMTKPEKRKHNTLVNKEGEINRTASIMLILLILLFVYFAFRLLKLLKGRKRAGRTYSLRDIRADDNKRAILAMMYRIDKAGRKYSLDGDKLKAAKKIYEEVKYSNHEITSEKRNKMRALYYDLKKQRRKKSNGRSILKKGRENCNEKEN